MNSSTSIDFKNRDTLEEYTKLMPLTHPISDREGVLAEHLILNGRTNNQLNFALIKLNGDYYFFEAKDTVIEVKKETDNNMFICPYCMQEMFIVGGYTRKNNINVRAHLRHYANNVESENCIFNHHNPDADKIKEAIYSGETLIHKVLKQEIYMKANAGKLKFQLPVDYNIEVDEENFTCRVDFDYYTVKVKSAEKEIQVLKKDELTAGYRPDLSFVLDNDENMFCEITYQSGKTVEDYYDIWKRLKSTVIEVRRTDNYINLNYSKDSDVVNAYIDDDFTFRFLYNEVIDTARSEKIQIMKILADRELEYLKIQEKERVASEKKKIEIEEKERAEYIRIKEENKTEEEKDRVEYEKEIKSEKSRICKSKQCTFFKTCLITDIEKLNHCTGVLVKNIESNK